MTHGIQGHSRRAVVDARTAHQVAETMQALATPSRVRILGRLRDGACSVNELAAAVEMEASAVSHQLRVLRHLGLVVGERQGRTEQRGAGKRRLAESATGELDGVGHGRLPDFLAGL